MTYFWGTPSRLTYTVLSKSQLWPKIYNALSSLLPQSKSYPNREARLKFNKSEKPEVKLWKVSKLIKMSFKFSENAWKPSTVLVSRHSKSEGIC